MNQNIKTIWTAAIIVVIATIIAAVSTWRDAPIVDEIPHIGAGYGYILEQSYKFNPEHPPLAKDLAGIGLKIAGLNKEISRQLFIVHSQTVNDQWNFGRNLLYNIGNDAIKMVRAAKLAVLPLFMFSALLVFIWTRKLYGNKASLLAVFLFSFSPTMLAHSRFVTTDVAALFGILLASYFFIKYLENQSRKNFWLAGTALGIALLCKFSTFLLLPFFFLLVIAWAYARKQRFWPLLGRMILVVAVAFIVIVGPYYQLHLTNYPAAEQKADTAALLQSYGNRALAETVIAASGTPVLRPLAEYGLGLLMVNQRIAGGNRIYFLGEVVNQGGPWYFPVVYAIKEPIPFLALLLIAIISGLMLFLRGRLGSFRHAIAIYFPQAAMLLWLLIYWAFSIQSTVNIGVRHLIPIFGFTAILMAGQITQLVDRGWLISKKYWRLLIGILLLWFLAESAFAHPYYLTYFNQFAGGPAGGHRYVTDSNLDWGQDLWRLNDWAEKNNVQKISLDYFGWADQRYYLGDKFVWVVGGQYTNRETFLRDNPQGGYIAISATYFQQAIHSDTGYDWLKDIEPVQVVGNSIFVWHIAR